MSELQGQRGGRIKRRAKLEPASVRQARPDGQRDWLKDRERDARARQTKSHRTGTTATTHFRAQFHDEFMMSVSRRSRRPSRVLPVFNGSKPACGGSREPEEAFAATGAKDKFKTDGRMTNIVWHEGAQGRLAEPLPSVVVKQLLELSLATYSPQKRIVTILLFVIWTR